MNEIENMRKLQEKYEKFSKQWIKSLRNGTTGIGYTFECLLGKTEENFFVPDFKNIEIKTVRKNSLLKISLFNITPDGDYLFPIKRIIELLGYPDSKNPEFKVFNMSVDALSYTNIGYYKKIKLYVNRKLKKVELIYLYGNKKRDIDISWSFDLLRERLNLKLSTLVIVEADNKFIHGEEYFYYNNIKYYRLKKFDEFLNLIESGKIKITFKIGVFRSGRRYGQVHDRGTSFSMYLKDIKYLYDEISI